MITVLVQVSENCYWEDVLAVQHTFKDWSEMVHFAYRLALQTQRKVRVENKGNGHYFNPEYANEYLKVNTPH